MRRHTCWIGLLLGACAAPRAEWTPPKTVAEASDYARTSTSADVESFADSCVRAAPGILTRVSLGRSAEGRDVFAVLAADPPLRTLEEARADGRPVAVVIANIHAGEVEGKEALQELLRETALGSHDEIFRRAIVAFVPNYNPDGNDLIDRRNRADQAGPIEGVGVRPNGLGLDLNRDYLKAEAPETVALIRAVRELDALLIVDCHATNGSFHGYDLTYAGPLHPAADPSILAYVRRSFLPGVRADMSAAGFATFDYGNWVDPRDPSKGWESFEPHPRFGTTYFGLRNRLTLLSEAYSHDPFRKRIASTKALVLSALRRFADDGAAVAALCRAADLGAPRRERLPTKSERAFTGVEPVPVGSVRDEKDVATGLVRQWDTDVATPRLMPVWAHFDGAAYRPVPGEGWAVRTPSPRLLKLLDVHGVAFERLSEPRRAAIRAFVVTAKTFSPRAFQGFRLATFAGFDRMEEIDLPAGAVFIPKSQPLLALVFILCEPESEDGFGTWGVLGAASASDGTEVFESLRVEAFVR